MPFNSILHPTSSILHPTSYIQHPASYILFYPKKCKSLQFKDCIYIDDVLSINNKDFEIYLGSMYPTELVIKDTTESNTSASFLDLLLSIGRDGQLRTSLYDKLDDFNFIMTHFPFLSRNFPSSPAYGIFISKLSDMQWLAPLMNVLFWCQCDFSISFSGMDMSRNFWNRLSEISMVGTGILSNNMKSLSP